MSRKTSKTHGQSARLMDNTSILGRSLFSNWVMRWQELGRAVTFRVRPIRLRVAVRRLATPVVSPGRVTVWP